MALRLPNSHHGLVLDVIISIQVRISNNACCGTNFYKLHHHDGFCYSMLIHLGESTSTKTQTYYASNPEKPFFPCFIHNKLKSIHSLLNFIQNALNFFQVSMNPRYFLLTKFNLSSKINQVSTLRISIGTQAFGSTQFRFSISTSKLVAFKSKWMYKEVPMLLT